VVPLLLLATTAPVEVEMVVVEPVAELVVVEVPVVAAEPPVEETEPPVEEAEPPVEETAPPAVEEETAGVGTAHVTGLLQSTERYTV